MIIKLFDVSDGVLIPSEHCYALSSLKSVMEAFPDNYMKIYLYIFYMTCWDPEKNPFYNLPEDEKEEVILGEVKADFSTDDPVITNAVSFCHKIYDTPLRRAYEGMKSMMDKIAVFFKQQQLTTGRDGSLGQMTNTAEKYDKLQKSFKGIEKEFIEESRNRVLGDRYKAYDS